MKLPADKRLVFCLALFFLSAIFLTLVQPSFGLSWLAWAAYVPFMLACFKYNNSKGLYVTAYVVSFFYWLFNLHWVGPVTYIGWIIFCAYIALLWPLLIFCLKFCIKRKIPFFIAAAFLVAGVERLQGVFLGGFFWRFLGHSQYENLVLIQIADIVGASGVSFVLAMVNGLIAELIAEALDKRFRWKINIPKTAFTAVILSAIICYGNYRLAQGRETISEGPLIGAVQSNIPQSIKDSSSEQENREQFTDVLAISVDCKASGAELIIWPETIVPGILDTTILAMLGENHIYNYFDTKLAQHSKKGVYLLVGAPSGTPQVKDDWTIELVEKFNSAFLYRPDGTKGPKKYSKIHLVPFGEYVPFTKSAAWLHSLLMKFTPYDFDYSLDPGKEHTVFEINSRQNDKLKKYRFGVVICYEGTLPSIVTNAVVDESGNKKIDFLVNISNDGWFVNFANTKIRPSSELVEHNAVYAFRAIENRIAIIRSVNTGISSLIEPSGKIRDGFAAASDGFAEKPDLRAGIAGWFADKMPIDKRKTIYSSYGRWFEIACQAAVLAIVFFVLCKKFFGSKFFKKKRR